MSETTTSRSYTREITAFIAAIPAVWLVGWAPAWGYIAAVVVVCALALYEFLVLGEKKGYPVQKFVSIVLMLLMHLAFVAGHRFEAVSVEMTVVLTLLVIPAAYVFAESELEAALPATAVCVLGTLYIGMLGGALLRLRLDFGTSGPKLVFFLLFVVWAGDAGAYYVGKRFGKTRLSPRVSPKKTVEGGVGGVLTAIIVATIIHFTFFREFPLVHALIAAGILSFSGVIGDLAESLWKRSAAVKDSSTLIPGHGGFLDRFDSILFTAPILYAYWFLLTDTSVRALFD
jgi:phosphatidate cytidylyltransferase